MTQGQRALEKSASKSPCPQNRFIDLTVSNLSEVRNGQTSPRPVQLLSTGKKPKALRLARNSSDKKARWGRSSAKKPGNVSQSVVYCHNDVSLDDTSLLDIQKALAESEKRFSNTLEVSCSKNRLNFPSMTQDQFYLSVSPQKAEERREPQAIEERTSESDINTSRRQSCQQRITGTDEG